MPVADSGYVSQAKLNANHELYWKAQLHLYRNAAYANLYAARNYGTPEQIASIEKSIDDRFGTHLYRSETIDEFINSVEPLNPRPLVVNGTRSSNAGTHAGAPITMEAVEPEPRLDEDEGYENHELPEPELGLEPTILRQTQLRLPLGLEPTRGVPRPRITREEHEALQRQLHNPSELFEEHKAPARIHRPTVLRIYPSGDSLFEEHKQHGQYTSASGIGRRGRRVARRKIGRGLTTRQKIIVGEVRAGNNNPILLSEANSLRRVPFNAR